MLRFYKVGLCDYILAETPVQALSILREYVGVEEFEQYMIDEFDVKEVPPTTQVYDKDLQVIGEIGYLFRHRKQPGYLYSDC